MTNTNVYDVIDRIAADGHEQNLETGLKTALKQFKELSYHRSVPWTSLVRGIPSLYGTSGLLIVLPGWLLWGGFYISHGLQQSDLLECIPVMVKWLLYTVSMTTESSVYMPHIYVRTYVCLFTHHLYTIGTYILPCECSVGYQMVATVIW